MKIGIVGKHDSIIVLILMGLPRAARQHVLAQAGSLDDITLGALDCAQHTTHTPKERS